MMIPVVVIHRGDWDDPVEFAGVYYLQSEAEVEELRRHLSEGFQVIDARPDNTSTANTVEEVVTDVAHQMEPPTRGG